MGTEETPGTPGRDEQGGADEGDEGGGGGGLAALLLRLAIGFVNIPSDEIDAAIDDALAAVGRFSGVSRAYLFRYDHTERTASNTHEWCAPGIDPAILREQAIPFEHIPEQLEAHRANRIRHVADVADLPRDAPWRARLEAQDIRTLVTVPLWDHDALIGFAGFDAVGTPRRWSNQDLELLTVLGELLANAEYRRRQLQLQRTVESLSVSNGELQRFAGTVSHDLRGPLATVRSMVELVRDGYITSEQAQLLLNGSLLNIDRTIELVDGLLAHAQAGRVVGEPAPVHLGAVIEQAVDALGERVAAREAVIEVGAMPTVLGDRVRLASVFQNLIGNALIHVPEDRIPQIGVRYRSFTRGQVEVLVRDNGDGVPLARRSAALETFERGEDARGRPGSGLGLAICRRIVAAHGGELRLASAPGGGLEVQVRLPATG